MSEYITEWVSHSIEDPFVREEIVRCRDCKWFVHDEQFGDSCRWWCRNTNPDGFCHGGDRKRTNDE